MNFRLLMLYPGDVPPPIDLNLSKHHWLSAIAGGHVLLPVWWASVEELRAKLPASGVNDFSHSGFQFHLLLARRYLKPLRGLAKFCFYIITGAAVLRSDKSINVIVSYGTNINGLAALVLARVFGLPLICEIPGVPRKAFVLDTARPNLFTRIKRSLAEVFLNLCLKGSKAVKLLYPGQIEEEQGGPNRYVFHEFVPTTYLAHRPTTDENFVFFLGSPWHLKGVDVLIQAFNECAEDCPGYRLVIAGHCPDRSTYESLANGSDRIEFLPGLPYEEAMSLMSRCSVFVLPSRTEAMGCVLLEAMSCGKAVIAARVDGIPHYVHDRETGLLFDSEDHQHLARQLKDVLNDSELRSRLAQAGREMALSRYSEKQYVGAYQGMLEETLVSKELNRS